MTSAIQSPNTPSAPSIGKVLVPVFLIVFTDIMGFGLMIPLLPFYAEHFGASAFTVGLLLSVFALCQLLAGPPLGQLSDRIGRKTRVLLRALLNQPCRIARNLAISERDLERLPEDVLVAVLGRRRPVVLLQPGVDLGGQDSSATRSPKSLRMMFIRMRKFLMSFRPCSIYQSMACLPRTSNLTPLFFMLSGSFTPRRASALRILYRSLASFLRPDFLAALDGHRCSSEGREEGP